MAVGAGLRVAARPALEATLAMAVTVGVLAAAHEPGGVLVLGAVLAMTLARSRLNATWRSRGEAAIALPALSLATAGVGWLLVSVPPAGAALFTLALAASVWLRRFGTAWRRVGGLIALPFVTLLVGGGFAHDAGILSVVLASLVALAAAIVVRVIAVRIDGPAALPPDPPASSARVSSLRPIASTRMAVQLAVALAAAFTVGFLAFGEHWGWVVLTAYLVQSGTRGRADVLLKAGLRVVGAAAGALVVGLIAGRLEIGGPAVAVVAILLLGVGLVGRAANYAWWALTMTIVLGLVQQALTDAPADPFPRVLAIVVGAVLGVAAAWLVLPVRSTQVLRRRIADLLAALAARAAGEPADVATAAARLEEVARPFVAIRRLPRAGAPGRWILALREALVVLPDGPSGAPVRRAIGQARAALRDRTDLGPSLARLREAGAEAG